MSKLPTPPPDFHEILDLITVARQRAYQAVNTALIDLYWQVGEHLSRKIASAEWGAGVVDQLARHIAGTHPGIRGFTRSNLLRMRQFYETYCDHPIVAPLPRQLSESQEPASRHEIVAALLRQLPWTHHVIIIGQSKRPEEREFYLRLAIREKWSRLTCGIASSKLQRHERLHRRYSLKAPSPHCRWQIRGVGE